MFELARPWVLLMLLLPLGIWWLLPRVILYLPVALKIPFYQALLSLINKEKKFRFGFQSLSWFAVIWCLAVAALAGPRWVGEPIPLAREGRNIMMVLDLSGSMELNDMTLNGRPVSRLTVVKRAAKEFVAARVGDRLGLILFGTKAYLQTPLTFDRQNVLQRIDDATVGLAGKTTSIGDALGLAIKRLENVPKASRIIILLTDGVNNSGVLDPLKAAELAKDDAIKIYTIGLGSEGDQRFLGNIIFNADMDLDEKTLQEIADKTGGRYFRATDTQSLHQIYSKISSLEAVSQEKILMRPQKEYYPWPLALALLLLLVWLGQKANFVMPVRRSTP